MDCCWAQSKSRNFLAISICLLRDAAVHRISTVWIYLLDSIVSVSVMLRCPMAESGRKVRSGTFLRSIFSSSQYWDSFNIYKRRTNPSADIHPACTLVINTQNECLWCRCMSLARCITTLFNCLCMKQGHFDVGITKVCRFYKNMFVSLAFYILELNCA